MSKVEWRPIPGYEGLYEVSSDGRVRSCERTVRVVRPDGTEIKRTYAAKMRKAPVCGGPYRRLGLRKDGKDTYFRVHTLVLLAFVGPAPEENSVCRHLNGDCLDNRRSNLAWGSYAENAGDRHDHGTMLRGESAPWRKHDLNTVRWITAFVLSGHYDVTSAARTFGVPHAAIYSWVIGASWADETGDLRTYRPWRVRPVKLHSDETKRTAASLFEQGLRAVDVGRCLGVHRRTVGHWKKRWVRGELTP